ncbi:B3 domain-containing protein [Carex littledalei]|uniref:B3 domain-containing protein n=1 Tax=Carex littledalei TaxID=544730 RepID=A0A833QQR3_9POAL|nr:B3 domain-containing protein [Carex littledalei]
MEQPKSSSSTPNHKPHFFKFLFPDPFANLNLRIPEKFYKHLPAVLPKQASLVSTQSDKFWRVDVCQNEQGICFSRGWPEFAKAHHLQIGYLLVFRYEGNMVFHVKVFDTTSCLMDYSLKIKSQGETQIPVASGRKRNNATGKAQLVGEEEEEEEEKPIIKNRVQKKLTLKMPTVPQFEKTLGCTSTNNHRRLLYIPKWFCEENGLVSERTMFLKNSKGKKWRVKFTIRRKAGLLTMGLLTVGWRVFSTENRLRKGDECIFKLIDRNTFLVDVHGIGIGIIN